MNRDIGGIEGDGLTVGGGPLFDPAHRDQHDSEVAEGGVVAGIDALVSGRVSRQTINVAYGQGSTLVDLVNILALALGKEPDVTYEPARVGEVTRYVADITKAQELLGYAPATPLTAGLPKYLKWSRSVGAIE